jgi:curved DNA-binding protein CbpA
LDNHYKLLGIQPGASTAEIKKAFRQKAKQLHPDIAGIQHSEEMRRLIKAYEALSDVEHRFEYDRIFASYANRAGFDSLQRRFHYRTWLNEQEDPASKAKLVFYELLRLNEERAIEVWRENGGLGFRMENFLERGDWMDCCFLLAEELEKRGFVFEAFKLLTVILAEEKRRVYFNLFTPEIKHYLLIMAKKKLREQVDSETWIDCMESVLGIGFSEQDEKFFKDSIANALKEIRSQ